MILCLLLYIDIFTIVVSMSCEVYTNMSNIQLF